jgi:hypothetical protein
MRRMRQDVRATMAVATWEIVLFVTLRETSLDISTASARVPTEVACSKTDANGDGISVDQTN